MPVTTLPIEDMIPQEGFFPSYISYAMSMSDAPEIYHLAAAISTFATAVSRSASLQLTLANGAQAEFPLHMWVLILGKSGSRKSSAAERLVGLVEPFIGELGPTTGSPEAFFTWIAAHPTCLFYYPEMATLFSLQQASYWQQAQAFFMEIYDARKVYRRSLLVTEKNRKRGLLNIEIFNPRVNMLGCATPSLLDSSTREIDWTGGLLGRMLLLYGDRTGLTVWPNQRLPEQEEYIAGMLSGIIQAVGDGAAVGMSPDAMAAYANWCTELDATIEDYPERLQPLITRIPHHILRISALYALSSLYADVDIDIMMRAINLGDFARSTLVQLGEMLTPDRIARLSKALREKLQNAPEYTLSIRDALSALNVSWKTLEPAVKSLEQAGDVWVILDPQTQRRWIKLIK